MRVRFSGEVIVGPMHTPGGKLRVKCKSHASKEVAQAFLSGLCIHDGLRMQVWSQVSMGDISSQVSWRLLIMWWLSQRGKSSVFHIKGVP